MTEEEIFNKIAELIADNFQLDKDTRKTLPRSGMP